MIELRIIIDSGVRVSAYSDNKHTEDDMKLFRRFQEFIRSTIPENIKPAFDVEEGALLRDTQKRN
jgi:hypothetical protein